MTPFSIAPLQRATYELEQQRHDGLRVDDAAIGDGPRGLGERQEDDLDVFVGVRLRIGRFDVPGQEKPDAFVGEPGRRVDPAQWLEWCGGPVPRLLQQLPR